ncbi:MAG: UDP-glucose 4-epimerase GalE [Rhizomicrobium sp.]
MDQMHKALRNTVLVSGGAGYIGSHVTYALQQRGFTPVVIDSLVTGNKWATRHAATFHQADIADAAAVRSLCETFRPVAALHFAAFIEVGESVSNPQKYFSNNRDKAKAFFDILSEQKVDKVIFSSTAAVYGEPAQEGPITEDCQGLPINPYGQSKLEAETLLRAIPDVASVILRYFNVAGSAAEAGLGEAHFPETHLLPRLVLSLLDVPDDIQRELGLGKAFRVFGQDHKTRDGSAVRDYLHVLDLAEAHVAALEYLLDGGASQILNLGTGRGCSVWEIVRAASEVLGRPDFKPLVGERREGDPATLVASGKKAGEILGWSPRRDISEMIRSAAAWHRSEFYVEAIRAKIGALTPVP